MIKRYLCLNSELEAPRDLVSEKRLIFANSSFGRSGAGQSGSGSATGAGKETANSAITMENLEDRLLELEDEKKLSKDAVTDALNALKNGDDAIKMKVLKAARKVADGSYQEADFIARLPRLPRSAEKNKAADKVETKLGAESQPKSSARAEIVNIINRTRNFSAEMLENAKVWEEAYKKREDISEDLKRDFEKIKQELEELNSFDKRNNEAFDAKVQQALEPLVKAGKVTADEAKQIVALDYLDDAFAEGRKEDKKLGIKAEKGFNELTAKCDDAKSKEAVARILELKKQQAEKNKRVEDDVRKKAAELRRIMEHVGDAITQKAEREKAIKNMILSTGINMVAGQKLSYTGLKIDKDRLLKPVRMEAEIKEIKFLDKSSPLITVESTNPQTGEKVTDQVTLSGFIRLVDAWGATEKIDTLKELENSVGHPVAAGDTYTYVYQAEADKNLEIEEKTLKIEKIDEVQGQIVLSEDVKLSPEGTPNRYLTYGEFAKWHKQHEAMKEITDIGKLRDELIAHNEYLNSLYERKNADYPPIRVEAQEVLKYDDGSGRTFVIKEVGKDHITLDNGRKYSFTGFLRWVKRNEVEKMTAQSEAAQATELSKDNFEKEKVLKEQEKEVDKRKAESRKHPGASPAHSDSHEHAGHSVSYFKKLWSDTHFISLHGLYEMGKTVIELTKRKLKRSEHDRVGTVGSEMFAPIWTELGAEFKSVAQHAENEEVDHHIKHYRTMGIEFLKHELHAAPTKDILKAAVTVLCEKGQMRWDDHAFWDAMNKYAYGKLRDENGEVMWVNKNNYMYAIEKYMDSWWGNDTFREFRNKQDSSYNSIKSNFKDHAIRLGNDPEKNGGLRTALSKLLYQHLHGEYVNAAQYESYIHYAISAGKLSFEDKLFFIIMGVGSTSGGPHGQTLLHIDRVAALEGELLNNFPILDFLVSPLVPMYDDNLEPKLDQDGNPIRGMPDVNTFRRWIKDYLSKDFGGDPMSVTHPKDLRPGAHTREFVYKVAVWDDWMRTRLHKAASNAGRWDHDDMDVHAAFLTDAMIDQIVTKQGGATQQISTPGLKNSIVGFNNFIKVKLEMLDEHKKSGNAQEAQKDMRNLVDLIKSFTKFDAVLDDRFYHGGNYARLSQSDYYSYALADSSRTVKTHVDETRAYIGNLCQALDAATENRYGLSAMWREVLRERTPNKDAQTAAVKDIGIKIEGALKELQMKGIDVSDFFLAHKGIVKGIGHKIENKAEADKESASVFEFRPYVDQQMVAKIEEYMEIVKKIGTVVSKTPEQIKEEEWRRLEEILHEYQSGQYASRPGDAKVLDNAIAAKKGELAEKMGAGMGAGVKK